ncbi:MAG: cation:proton antiporter, partial [Planctomycetes bacterium]|nr:cation:proton antiporter [Planctomycetota bacterium]
MHGLLQDIGIAVLAATGGGLTAYLLRQPILLGYLVAGAAIGPGFLGVVRDLDNIEIISEIGLALLLFIVGLEMNLPKLLASGRQVLAAGGVQVALCLGLGLLFFPLVGYPITGLASEAVYLAIACAVSSTAIVVKLLYDKVEADTLAGRITIGLLVVQDLFAILVLAFQPNFAAPAILPVIEVLAQTAALLAGGFLLSKYVLQRLFARIANSPELVVSTSIGWCAAVAGVAGAIGLSKEMGALIAGMSIAAFPYSIHVAAKTLPLRDFFLTLFFISLGMKITAPTWEMATAVPLVVGFVLLSRFLSAYPALIALGAGRRTAFVVSLNLAQISEFALVIAALGAKPFPDPLGGKPMAHIDAALVEMLVYAMAVSAVVSSYAIKYSHHLYHAWDRVLTRAGRPTKRWVAEDGPSAAEHPIVLLGFHRVGRALVERLVRDEPDLAAKLLVVDFNIEVLRELKALGVAHIFGDIGSIDTLRHADLARAHLVLSLV